MIDRNIKEKIIKLAQSFPALGIMGPRQSGKTTLVKEIFPEYTYVTLEDADTQLFAKNDARSFLEVYTKKKGLIIDEAQRVPELFSYLQGIIDAVYRPGFFILTGSQHFLLHEKITQTLAGRIALLSLLPLSVDELKKSHNLPQDVETLLLKGGYPRLYDQNIEIKDWCANYINTYVEKDVRNTLQISDLLSFQKFLKLCAARVGNLINYADLGRDADISSHTAKSWLSVLKASYIIDLVAPYHNNFSKRLIKSPKLYFYDTALICFLLNIKTAEDLAIHPLKGAIFESFVFTEFSKYFYNNGEQLPLYFWRDVQGHEIDFIIEKSYRDIIACEVKARKTINDDFFKEVRDWMKISGQKNVPYVAYIGDENMTRKDGELISWKNLDIICK